MDLLACLPSITSSRDNQWLHMVPGSRGLKKKKKSAVGAFDAMVMDFAWVIHHDIQLSRTRSRCFIRL